MRKQLPLIILLAIVGIIGFLVYQVNEMRKMRGEFSGIRNEYLYDTLSNEYADIFDSTIISKSGNFFTHGSKRTNPISTFTYDNKFDILIYKLNITTTNPAFLRNIKEKKTSTGPANKTWYRTCDLAYLEIQYREVFSKDLQEIIVCFEKNTRVNSLIKSDSIVYYHIPDGKFSLRFGKDSAVNLCSEFGNTPFFTTTPHYIYFFLKKVNTITCCLRLVKAKQICRKIF